MTKPLIKKEIIPLDDLECRDMVAGEIVDCYDNEKFLEWVKDSDGDEKQIG
jgi:hypothetical protein